MRRHEAPITSRLRSEAAKPAARRLPSGTASARTSARPLSVVFVVLAVFAASLVFAHTSSAHEVSPTYTCDSGEPNGDNECVTTTRIAPTVTYSCAEGTPDDNNECERTIETDAAASCSSGSLDGGRCLHTAGPTYSCSTGTLSGTRCLHTANPTYSCSSGTLSGTQCLHTANPTYSCSSGTLSGSQCQTTTSATASCSSGSLSGSQCLQVVSANPGCPSGYQAGPFDTCYKYTSPTYSCSSGTLSGTSCITTTPANANCPSGYLTGPFGICYKYTAANSSCSAGYQLGSFTLFGSVITYCYKHTAPDYTCSTGTLSGDKCLTTTTVDATPRYSCPTEYELERLTILGSPVTYCTRTTTTDATPNCSEGTWNGTTCAHTHPGPVISDLDATGESAAGTDYTDNFTVAPTTATVLLSGAGCTLSGTAGPYTLTARSAVAATVTCMISAVDTTSTTATATITFTTGPVISDLDATGTSVAGVDYTDDFTVAPSDTSVTATGTGCSVAGTAGSYILTARRADAGTRTCTIAAGATTAAATITFTTGPVISGLDATGTSVAGVDYTDDFTVAPTTATVLLSGAGCTLSGTAGSYTLTARRADAGTRTCTIAAGATTAAATITFTTGPVISGLDATGTSVAGVDYTDDFTVAPSDTSVTAAGTDCSVAGTAGSYTLTARRADAGTRTCTITAGTTTAAATITFTTPPAPVISGLDATGTSVAGTDYTDNFTVAPSDTSVTATGTDCSVAGSAGSYILTASRADAGTRTCTIAAVDTTSTTAAATITFTTPPAPVISGLDATGTSVAGVDYTDDFTVAPSDTSVTATGTDCSVAGTVGTYTLTASRTDAGTRTCTITAGTTTAAATITFTAVVVHTRRPNTPQNLRCTAATATTATWTWEAADRAHSYWYRYSRSGDWAQAGGQDARSHTRTGITPSSGVGGWNNWRYFYLKATNNVGDSSQNPGSCLTLPPGWLSAECSSTGHITATWTKPLGLNSVSTVRYTGTITDPDGGTLARHDGTGTTLTGTGTPGTTYNIAVSTQPITNKPAYSEATAAECEPGPPPAPAGLECTQDLADLLAPYATECTWSAVTSTETSRYKLQTRWLNSDGTWTLPLSVTSPATSVVRALAARTYQARVQANQPTEGAWSDWTEPFEIVVPPPPAPTGVVVECTTGNDVVVKWVPSSGASQYKVAVTARPRPAGPPRKTTPCRTRMCPPARR